MKYRALQTQFEEGLLFPTETRINTAFARSLETKAQAKLDFALGER
jgi:hypothetical protein